MKLRKRFLTLGTLVLLGTSLVPISPTSASPVCTITGTNKADTIIGTSGNDVICGLGGNDRINGLSGDDTLIGGNGNDYLIGGDGYDYLDGGIGNDQLDGGLDADDISGDAGNDQIWGGSGDDELNGELGNDSIFGGDGRDYLEGQSGKDTIRGEAGDDLIDGGLDRDTITSGRGNDTCTKDSKDIHTDPCLLDNVGPEFGVMTTEVKNFSVGSKLDITWTLSDPSGIRDSWVVISSPNGQINTLCGDGLAIPADRIAGDEKSGTYAFDCTVPALAASGSYTLYAGAVDQLGNGKRISIPFTVRE